MSNLKRWSTADAQDMYGVQGWGRGYFGINAAGHMVALPHGDAGQGDSRAGDPEQGIDLKQLLDDAQAQGLTLPLLVRFSDILQNRLITLNECFRQAIAAHAYEGEYLGVYPIKVNQQRQVVEEVVRYGAPYRTGLEVGSKTELHAALAALETPGALIICNGFKDRSYVRLALLAQKLGRTVFLVLEKPGELPLILEEAVAAGVEPRLGLRVRLVASGSGRWEDSGGDYSKFGMASWEVLSVVEHLRAADKLHTLRLLHAHLGSQINNLRRVKEASVEVGRYLVELSRLGCPLDHVDMGGGLGVDYDGTHSTFGFSVNYTEQQYAEAIVSTMAAACREEGLAHPNLVTESGRAMVAHHAMLAINVRETGTLGSEHWDGGDAAGECEAQQQMAALLASLNPRAVLSHWEDARHLRDEALKLFEMGLLSLPQRAQVEQTFWALAARVQSLAARLKRVPEEFEGLEALMADKYYCNFSVFQSLPDAWAIHQEFPIVPLHRLDERPTRNAILQDLTCDSDGRIGQYIGSMDQRDSMLLHEFRPGEPYYLGVFLTGAYQEILGDLHNLFGDTHAIHVTQDSDGHWHFEQVIQGESVAQVLGYVQFHRDLLVDRIERQVQDAQRAGRMTVAEGKAFRDLYAQGLDGMTYLEPPATLASQSGAKVRTG